MVERKPSQYGSHQVPCFPKLSVCTALLAHGTCRADSNCSCAELRRWAQQPQPVRTICAARYRRHHPQSWMLWCTRSRATWLPLQHPKDLFAASESMQSPSHHLRVVILPLPWIYIPLDWHHMHASVISWRAIRVLTTHTKQLHWLSSCMIEDLIKLRNTCTAAYALLIVDFKFQPRANNFLLFPYPDRTQKNEVEAGRTDHGIVFFIYFPFSVFVPNLCPR